MSTANIVVSAQAPLLGAGDLFVIDDLDREISIVNVGTNVALLTAYNIIYDEKDKKWRPYYHVGVLCSNNKFKIENQEFIYCLLHALPANETDCRTSINLYFSNAKSDAEKMLGKYVPGDGYYAYAVYEKSIGRTEIPLIKLFELSKSITDKIFTLGGVRERITSRNPVLIADGSTSCLHTALLILEAMGYPKKYNDGVIELLSLTYRRAIDMSAKYANGDYRRLALDMVRVSGYRYEVDEGTLDELKKIITDLLDEKPEL